MTHMVFVVTASQPSTTPMGDLEPYTKTWLSTIVIKTSNVGIYIFWITIFNPPIRVSDTCSDTKVVLEGAYQLSKMLFFFFFCNLSTPSFHKLYTNVKLLLGSLTGISSPYHILYKPWTVWTVITIQKYTAYENVYTPAYSNTDNNTSIYICVFHREFKCSSMPISLKLSSSSVTHSLKLQSSDAILQSVNLRHKYSL